MWSIVVFLAVAMINMKFSSSCDDSYIRRRYPHFVVGTGHLYVAGSEFLHEEIFEVHFCDVSSIEEFKNQLVYKYNLTSRDALSKYVGDILYQRGIPVADRINACKQWCEIQEWSISQKLFFEATLEERNYNVRYPRYDSRNVFVNPFDDLKLLISTSDPSLTVFSHKNIKNVEQEDIFLFYGSSNFDFVFQLFELLSPSLGSAVRSCLYDNLDNFCRKPKATSIVIIDRSYLANFRRNVVFSGRCIILHSQLDVDDVIDDTARMIHLGMTNFIRSSLHGISFAGFHVTKPFHQVAMAVFKDLIYSNTNAHSQVIYPHFTKDNLVVLDEDILSRYRTSYQMAWEKNYDVIFVKTIEIDQLLTLLLRSKVVVDLTMDGDDSLIILGALCGAIPIISNRWNGGDFIDFPGIQRVDPFNVTDISLAISNAITNYHQSVLSPSNIDFFAYSLNSLRRSYDSMTLVLESSRLHFVLESHSIVEENMQIFQLISILHMFPAASITLIVEEEIWFWKHHLLLWRILHRNGMVRSSTTTGSFAVLGQDNGAIVKECDRGDDDNSDNDCDSTVSVEYQIELVGRERLDGCEDKVILPRWAKVGLYLDSSVGIGNPIELLNEIDRIIEPRRAHSDIGYYLIKSSNDLINNQNLSESDRNRNGNNYGEDGERIGAFLFSSSSAFRNFHKTVAEMNPLFSSLKISSSLFPSLCSYLFPSNVIFEDNWWNPRRSMLWQSLRESPFYEHRTSFVC